MFGGKKEPEKLVGARAKIEHAKKFKKGYQVESKREGKAPDPKVAVGVVLALAIGLAALMTEGVLKTGAGIGTGNAKFDKILFGPGEPPLMGDASIDYFLIIFIRGLAIFIAAGILPGATYLWQRLMDKAQMNIYISTWGVTVGLALIYYIGRDFLADIFKELIAVFV